MLEARKAALADAELGLGLPPSGSTSPCRCARSARDASTRSARRSTRSSRSSARWVSPSRRGRTSRTTGPTSARSTSRPSIRRGRRWTPSTCRASATVAGSFCAPTPRRCRCGRCWRSSRRSASSRRAAPTDRTTTRRTRRCSTRSRAWSSTSTHMGHLKGCLIEFLRAYFALDDLPVRFRPSYFPHRAVRRGRHRLHAHRRHVAHR